MNRPRDIEVLEALFVGDDVERQDVVRVADHAAQDAELRGVYNRLALVDETIGGDFEQEFGEALFLEALDDMLAEEEQSNVVVLEDRRRARRPIEAWLAAAALVALAFGALASGEMRRQSPEFQARSAVAAAQSQYDNPRLEVFCVERDQGEVRFRGQRESEFATVECPVDAEIKLAVRNTDHNLRYAAFFGIGPDNTLYWYGPSPAAAEEFALTDSDELQSVGETIRLQVNHQPGTVRVIGLFAETPLPWDRVRRWSGMNALQLRGGDLELERGTVIRQTFEVVTP